jgi:hypothetical protein
VRHVREAEGDAELLLADLQAPELVLQHDGHLAGVALAQGRRDLAFRVVGAEGDVEMVVSGQTVFGDMDQGAAHDTAQRIFHHAVVPQVVASHFLRHVVFQTSL